jgi:hypothetical protein
MMFTVFRVVYYLELCNAKSFSINVHLYQIELLMFDNVQITKLTFVGEKMTYIVYSYNIA